jgi:hypothetical protein
MAADRRPTGRSGRAETPADDEPGPVLAALRRDLAGLPVDLRTGSVAMSAEALAKSIDLGPATYRFQSALVGQLVDCVERLRAQAPVEAEGDTVDDLNARRAARRRAASAG